jgi:hypothetical protein
LPIASGPANLSPDNNPTTGDHKQKGSDLGQLIGGESAVKKGNNDNSPTPPHVQNTTLIYHQTAHSSQSFDQLMIIANIQDRLLSS